MLKDKLPALKNWSRRAGKAATINAVLAEMKKEMTQGSNKKNPQPAEGVRF